MMDCLRDNVLSNSEVVHMDNPREESYPGKSFVLHLLRNESRYAVDRIKLYKKKRKKKKDKGIKCKVKGTGSKLDRYSESIETESSIRHPIVRF